MMDLSKLFHPVTLCAILLGLMVLVPDLAVAQSSASPFQTGATNLQASLLTLLTPIAVIVVMVLGVVAAAGRISWGWPIGAIVGIGIIFAAPTTVNWVKSLFGA